MRQCKVSAGVQSAALGSHRGKGISSEAGQRLEEENLQFGEWVWRLADCFFKEFEENQGAGKRVFAKEQEDTGASGKVLQTTD